MAKREALGKGLGALLGDANTGTARPARAVTPPPAEANEINTGVTEIMLDEVEVNPYQPRTHFDEEALQELADSIKTHGLIQPITVRKTAAGQYQIISGERRFRASKIAGLESIPAYIRTADNQGMIEMALIENIQREDLDAIEIALSYQQLIDECDLTQETLGKRVGKKRATVTNYLRLLSLPAEIQLAIRERKLSMGHARAIAGIEQEKNQLKVARKAIDEGLSVRQVEEMVKKLTEPKPAKQAVPEIVLPENYSRLIEVLEHYFNSNINIKRNDKGQGSITIPFANDTEIDIFLSRFNDK